MPGLANFTIGVPGASPQDADPLGRRSTQPQLGGLWPSSHIAGHFRGGGDDGDKEALGKYLGLVVELNTGLEPHQREGPPGIAW